MARYMSCADTAKLVRKALKENFPGIKFSVRSKSYAGGASIDIHWTDGPDRFSVEKITDRFAGARFDGMTDSQSYVTGTLDGEEVRFGSDYVMCHRDTSRTFVEAIVAQFARHWGIPLEKIKVVGDEKSAGIHYASLPYDEDHALHELLARTDAKYMYCAYEASKEREKREREEWERDEPRRKAEAEAEAAEWAAQEAYRRQAEEILREQAERVRQQHADERARREQAARARRSPITNKIQALTYLGLSYNATNDDVIKAFRAKAKAASDGRGGYVAGTDMDLLVQAKEKALEPAVRSSNIFETLRNAY